jgi:hypothetical protein
LAKSPVHVHNMLLCDVLFLTIFFLYSNWSIIWRISLYSHTDNYNYNYQFSHSYIISLELRICICKNNYGIYHAHSSQQITESRYFIQFSIGRKKSRITLTHDYLIARFGGFPEPRFGFVNPSVRPQKHLFISSFWCI